MLVVFGEVTTAIVAPSEFDNERRSSLHISGLEQQRRRRMSAGVPNRLTETQAHLQQSLRSGVVRVIFYLGLQLECEPWIILSSYILESRQKEIALQDSKILFGWGFPPSKQLAILPLEVDPLSSEK